MQYAVQTCGWLGIVDARTKREAVAALKSLASSASLLRSDVTESNVHRATDEQIDWHAVMSGRVDGSEANGDT